MIRGLVNAVKSGRISAERLDDSVRRQIAWKHELGLFKERMTPIDQIDRLVSGPETTVLTDEIATKAITLVRSEANLLPIDKNTKIAVLGFSNGVDGPLTMNSLVTALRAGGLRFTSAYLQENSLPEQVAAARKAASEADIVIAGLYGRVRSGAKNSVGIPDNGAAILKEAAGCGQEGHRDKFWQSICAGRISGIKNVSCCLRRYGEPAASLGAGLTRNAGHHGTAADLAAGTLSSRNGNSTFEKIDRFSDYH